MLTLPHSKNLCSEPALPLFSRGWGRSFCLPEATLWEEISWNNPWLAASSLNSDYDFLPVKAITFETPEFTLWPSSAEGRSSPPSFQSCLDDSVLPLQGTRVWPLAGEVLPASSLHSPHPRNASQKGKITGMLKKCWHLVFHPRDWLSEPGRPASQMLRDQPTGLTNYQESLWITVRLGCGWGSSLKINTSH